MTLDAFSEVFPDAEFWREQDGRRGYLVSDSEICFFCYSADGFTVSREYYARVVQFEGDRLVSIDPVELKR